MPIFHTTLTPAEVWKAAYDDATQTLRTSINAAIVGVQQEVSINAADDSIVVFQPNGASLHVFVDNLAIGVTAFQGTNPWIVSQVGSSPSSTGMSRVNAPVRVDYTGTPVTTSAYVTLVASMSGVAKMVQIFDSSGRALVLAFGAAASEVDQIYIEPGGNGPMPLDIPAGTRLSIKAVDASATQGQLLVSFLG